MNKQFWVATIIPVVHSSLDLRFRPDYESWPNLKLIKNLVFFFLNSMDVQSVKHELEYSTVKLPF